MSVAITPGGSPQEMSNLSGKLRCVAYARIPYRYWYYIAIFLSKRKKKGGGGEGGLLGENIPCGHGDLLDYYEMRSASRDAY